MGLRTRNWDRLGNGGLTFTELGFGTAPLGNLYKAISDDDARATLDAAWEGACAISIPHPSMVWDCLKLA